MPPIPRTVNLRRQVAISVRRRLASYIRGLNASAIADGAIMDTVQQVAYLACLEGYHPDQIHRRVQDAARLAEAVRTPRPRHHRETV